MAKITELKGKILQHKAITGIVFQSPYGIWIYIGHNLEYKVTNKDHIGALVARHVHSDDWEIANLDFLVNAYIGTGLWATCDDSDEPLDQKYDVEDVDDSAKVKIKTDIENFLITASSLLVDLQGGQIMHDFFLTRTSHGAGFWDRGLGETGEELTELCKKYSELSFVVGDDQKIYYE